MFKSHCLRLYIKRILSRTVLWLSRRQGRCFLPVTVAVISSGKFTVALLLSYLSVEYTYSIFVWLEACFLILCTSSFFQTDALEGVDVLRG